MENLALKSALEQTDDPRSALQQLRNAFAKRLGQLSGSELELFCKAVLHLLPLVPLIERMAFARQIAKLQDTPRELLIALANDHYLVSAPVLESAPMLTEDDLSETIRKFGAPVCLAIAKRAELSEQLTDKLMQDAELKVQYALAGNLGARLSRASIKAMFDISESDSRMSETLGRRRDLPSEMANGLSERGHVKKSASPAALMDHGKGRAGIVLTQDLLNAGRTRKPVKTLSYS